MLLQFEREKQSCRNEVPVVASVGDEVERVTAWVLGKARRKPLNATFAELKRYTNK